MCKYLHTLAPDIICLQEVFADDTGQYDTGRAIADTLNMQLNELPGRHKVRKLNAKPLMSHSGLAVLSRYPTEHMCTHALPSFEDDDRWLMHVCLSTPFGFFDVFNTHLTHVQGAIGMRQRLLQLSEVIKLAEPQYTNLAILAGDFNLTLNHRALSNIFNCQDCVSNGHKLESTLIGQKTRAIDHVFAFDRTSSWVVSNYYTCMDLTDPIEGTHASDHRAVVMELKQTFQMY